jgi:single-stranded-DNA-specific exonuclease
MRAIMRSASLQPGVISARDVGFVIGPRLNAPSRMDHASVALELMLARSDADADRLARDVERLNKARQEATVGMMREADELLETFPGDAHLHALWRSDWSPALVGLVAGRVADRYGVPVVAIGKHGNQWIGSGRSFPHYNITEAVKRVGKGLITRAGGHVQACGFALEDDGHVSLFAEKLREDAKERIGAHLVGPAIDVHAELPLPLVDWELIRTIERMEPFGAQNPEPVFVTRDIEVVSSSTVGKDSRHLRIIGKSANGKTHPFIAFGFADRVREVMHGNYIDIAYTVRASEWNGVRDIQCTVQDFHPASTDARVSDTIDRSTNEHVYR